MLTYDDAVSDQNLHTVWLTDRWQRWQLAEKVTDALRGIGFAVSRHFADGLEKQQPVDLADAIARNTPFDTDDWEWLEHCAKTYPVSEHGSLTAADRNRGVA